ncbi:MAG: heavy metal-associated domain-containing protein [Woeseiaceae bacterium]
MKKIILMSILSVATMLGTVQVSFAAGSNYSIRVDGLACPFCAYGIEKKFKAMDGISNIKVDLDNGIVSVDAKEGLELKEDKMIKLFNDSGFTYRSMKKTAQ